MNRIVSVDDNFDLPVQTRNRLASEHGLRIVDPALGDGVTDATAAIQSKLNQAGTDGGIVLIPKGTFMKSSSLSIPDGVTIQGLGPGQSTIRNYTGGGTTVLKNANTGGGGGITVRDLFLDGIKHGGAGDDSAYSTLHFYGVQQRSFISNVHAFGGDRRFNYPDPRSGRGECIEIEQSSYVQIDNVYVKDADYDGIKIRGGHRVQITNARAHNCNKDGLQWSSGGGIASSYCIATNLLVEHDTGVGIYGNPAITWHDTTYCQVVGLTVVGTGTVAGDAGVNVGARMADAVLRPRSGWGTRPAHGSNVVYHLYDGSSPAVHYAWWMGTNESLMTSS